MLFGNSYSGFCSDFFLINTFLAASAFCFLLSAVADDWMNCSLRALFITLASRVSLPLPRSIHRRAVLVKRCQRIRRHPLDAATAFAKQETIALLQQAGAKHGEGFRIKAAPTATGGHIPANVLNADLHTDAEEGKTETVELLIERRANIAAKDVAAKCCSSYSFQKYLTPPVLREKTTTSTSSRAFPKALRSPKSFLLVEACTYRV